MRRKEAGMSRIMIRIKLVTHVDAGDVFNDLQKTEKGQKKITIYLFIYLDFMLVRWWRCDPQHHLLRKYDQTFSL